MLRNEKKGERQYGCNGWRDGRSKAIELEENKGVKFGKALGVANLI